MKALDVRDRVRVLDAVGKNLMHEPLRETRNRKRLRNNPFASHELRVGNLRIFYWVEEERVQIEAIGRKIRNKLWIGEEEISL